MTQTPAGIDNLTYNAAEQRFEALVTFHTEEGRLRVASRYAAPLSAGFATVSQGLLADAKRARIAPDRLRARLLPKPPEPRRVPHEAQPRPKRAFDWLHWLHGNAA